ncbi:twin-arginine translocation signal domain-containing protein [Haloterrigena alkaliphila]|uniref:Uncharacterized protein n=1 Tax=Haloterrigena alkaliphila TaxID=2816475 RepID=A0A8A2VJH1_9EURY|nr:twin-arginine translocation signal domain-containing protein [Haloterrigena alkaliphila]QSX00851.1 twin-arginine translocation signal domain-containing protein [Haloterrigena alkaliphila]
MTSNGADRRTFLAGTAGTLATVAVAGCLGRSDDGDDDPEPVLDVAEGLESDTDPAAWRDIEELRFDGYVGGWLGLEPTAIDHIENPTLVLVEGRRYELTWENQDGVHHNFAFWDEDEEVVEDYSTEGTDVPGERETLVFEATPEMVTYRCEYQPARQLGDVELIPDPADGEESA